MYICLCRAITDAQLQQAVEDGTCSSLREAGERLGVATGCGKCGKHARTVIQEAMRSRSPAEVGQWQP